MQNLRSAKEIEAMSVNLVVLQPWSGLYESLERNIRLVKLAGQMGFSMLTLYNTLTAGISSLAYKDEENENIFIEPMTVHGRALDRLLIHAHPGLAKPDPKTLTQFRKGGEVIKVTGGSAYFTFTSRVDGNVIHKTDLMTVRVDPGALIVSTTSPNCWSAFTDDFTFMYFVGNPGGEQIYSSVPKIEIPVV